MTHRKTTARRLERAGYVALHGWVPASYAARVLREVEAHRETVEAIKARPVRARGRPKRED